MVEEKEDDIDFIEKKWNEDMKKGVINEDIFKDNEFFMGERI